MKYLSFYLVVVLVISPVIAINQSKEKDKQKKQTVENIEHYKELVRKTRHEVDSLLNRLPDLIQTESSGKRVNKRTKRIVRNVKKIHNELPGIAKNIPDTVLENDLGVLADTVEVMIVKPEKMPLFKKLKRIFKKKNKKR